MDVSQSFSEQLEIGQEIALRDLEGVILATITATDIWKPDQIKEAKKVFKTDDIAHPAVNYLLNNAGPIYIGGPVVGIQKPVHYDFRARRHTPNELRAHFQKLGWQLPGLEAKNCNLPSGSKGVPARLASSGL